MNLGRKEERAMKKTEMPQFEFQGNYDADLVLDRWGKVKCDICGRRFKSVNVKIIINDFLFCPTCIQTGPAAVAAAVELLAVDKNWIARTWGYTTSRLDQENIAGMARAYRKLASALRGLDSFKDLPRDNPSGNVVLAISWKIKEVPRPAKGKAA